MNAEPGRVIQKKVTSEITFEGYKRHASKEESQRRALDCLPTSDHLLNSG